MSRMFNILIQVITYLKRKRVSSDKCCKLSDINKESLHRKRDHRRYELSQRISIPLQQLIAKLSLNWRYVISIL